MAVGTIVCASLWTEFVTCEQTDERYNQLVRMVYLSDNLVCICNLYVDECYIADIKPSACARTLDYFCSLLFFFKLHPLQLLQFPKIKTTLENQLAVEIK